MKSVMLSIILMPIMLLCVLIFNANLGWGSSLSTDFHRINFNMGNNNPNPNSNWGEIDIGFVGSSDFQYFNLEVDGEWQIQNVPILSIEGAGNHQFLNFNFNLKDISMSSSDNMQYKASLTDSTLTDLSGISVSTTTLTTRDVTFGGDDIDYGDFNFWGPMPIFPLITPLIGWVPIDWAFHSGMPNQDVGLNECTPGAFSNSLKWLDAKYDFITIPDNKKSIEGLKVPLEWNNGTKANAWEGKKEALKNYVTTKYFKPEKIDDVIEEMKHGEDIELDGKGHYAAITGLIKHINGTYTIYVTHDTDQGNAGGTKTQPIIFDPVNNKFLSSAFGFPIGRGIDGFVSESPVPEPSTMILLGLGLLGLAGVSRRKQ